jgi:hypothetical protein
VLTEATSNRCCFEQRQPAADEIDAYAASVAETLLAGIGAGA